MYVKTLQKNLKFERSVKILLTQKMKKLHTNIQNISNNRNTQKVTLKRGGNEKCLQDFSQKK
jgi:hypothetical protein